MTSPVPADRRAEIIAAALPQLAQGVPTDQIAAAYGVMGRTLRVWIISDHGAEAELARCHYLSNELVRWQEQIEAADDTLPLARAREGFRAAAWLAERRLPRLFGQQRVDGAGAGAGVTVNIVLDALQQARQALARPAIDVTPEPDNDATSMP